MVKIIYFVHGTTVDNSKKLATGWSQGELTELGIEQVLKLKQQINIEEIDIVFCSDLKRAIDSANYIFKDSKKIVEDARLRECNYGDLNEKPTNLVKYEEHINSPFPSGESLKDVENRIKDFCKFLEDNYNDKTVAIVAHKAPQLALQVITEDKSWEEAINEDWRKTKDWKPGWRYTIKNKRKNKRKNK